MFFRRKPQDLCDSIQAGNLQSVRRYINADNCNEPDEYGRTPLHHAVLGQQAEVARYLLSLGCEPATGEPGQRRGLMEEVLRSLSLPLIEAFVAAGVPLPERIDGLPLLHALIRHEGVDEKLFAFLIAQGLDLNQIDTWATSRTVLAHYLGMTSGSISLERVRWLIRLGTDVNLAPGAWLSPLYVALHNPSLPDHSIAPSEATFERVLDILHESGLVADLDMDASGHVGLALRALEQRKWAGFVRLLELGVRIPENERIWLAPFFVRDNFSSALTLRLMAVNEARGLDLPVSIRLHHARGMRKIVEDLPQDSPSVHRMFRDLAVASGFSCEEKLSLLGELLDKGADINTGAVCDPFVVSALQMAVGWPERVEHSDALIPWLLDRGAAIECHGLSAFYLAVWLEHMEYAGLLAERGAQLFYRDYKGRTIFSQLFNARPARGGMNHSQTCDVLLRLHAIYSSRNAELPLNETFEYGEKVHDWMNRSRLLPEAACLYSAQFSMPLMRRVLDIGWPLNAEVRTDDFSGNIVAYFLRYAYMNEDLSPFLEALSASEVLDVNSPESGDPLRQAIVSVSTARTLEYLLERVDDLDRCVRWHVNGKTTEYIDEPYLIYAMDSIRPGFLERKTPEHQAYVWRVCRQLLEHGADPNVETQARLQPSANSTSGVTRLRTTALEEAAAHSLFEVFTLLLDHGADPRRRTCIKEEQLVHYLCTRQSGRPAEEIIRYLDELERRGLLDIEARTRQNATPLLYAASKCQTELVRYFLERGADVHAEGGFDNSCALHRAISNWDWVGKENRRDTVLALLTGGANVNQTDPDGDTPLTAAALYGCLTVVEALLSHGADVNRAGAKQRSALHQAIMGSYNYDSYPEDADCEDKYEFDAPAKLRIVELLLEQGAEIEAVDEDGDTPLICAIYMDRFDIFHLLLKQGADINRLDGRGRTPLMIAMEFGELRYPNSMGHDQRILETLHHVAGNGNNLLHAISLRNDHASAMDFFRTAMEAMEVEYKANAALITPLHYAAYRGNLDIVRYCCEQGIDANAADHAGNTPLHTALMSSPDGPDGIGEAHVREIVTSLLTAGADPNRANAEGRTPLDLAVRQELTDCVTLMSVLSASTAMYGPAGHNLS